MRYLLAFFLNILFSLNISASLNHVNTYTDDSYRHILSKGYPDHDHGQFPNTDNPNKILEQNYHFKAPLHPQKAGYLIPVSSKFYFGVALNGIPFDSNTRKFWHNEPKWRYEALSAKVHLGLDHNNAHVQKEGAYHYHGVPIGLVYKLYHAKKRLLLIGWAADGYPIYLDNHSKLTSSYQLKQGVRQSGPMGRYDGEFSQDYEFVMGSGKLDQCNGIEGRTNEFPEGTYFYVLSNQFPSVPRCFRGIPDKSFAKSSEIEAILK